MANIELRGEGKHPNTDSYEGDRVPCLKMPTKDCPALCPLNSLSRKLRSVMNNSLLGIQDIQPVADEIENVGKENCVNFPGHGIPEEVLQRTREDFDELRRNQQ